MMNIRVAADYTPSSQLVAASWQGGSLAAFRSAGARTTLDTEVTDCDARRWAEGQARPALPVGRVGMEPTCLSP